MLVGKKIPDFLPSPAELANMDKKEKITINLDKETLDYFKKQAKKYGVPYQAMIRNALSAVARKFKNA
jgi:predicted DNA binding CopG/RHH family protein